MATEVASRMAYCSALIRNFAKAFSKHRFPSRWRLNKHKLSLKGGKFCHLTTKGWQTAIIMRWLNSFMCRDNVDIDPDLQSLVWSACNWVGFLNDKAKESMFLSADDASQVASVGYFFQRCYLTVHNNYKGFCAFKLFNVRPKFHMLSHLFDDVQSRRKNPMCNSCWHDEGWLKTIMAIARKTHKQTTQSSTLKRYLTGQHLVLPC